MSSKDRKPQNSEHLKEIKDAFMQFAKDSRRIKHSDRKFRKIIFSMLQFIHDIEQYSKNIELQTIHQFRIA
ncbi:unnamed protein product [Schistosoma turkestanicum]|nr:unnamed protein product [Schistosoma turkestanicum]